MSGSAPAGCVAAWSVHYPGYHRDVAIWLQIRLLTEIGDNMHYPMRDGLDRFLTGRLVFYIKKNH